MRTDKFSNSYVKSYPFIFPFLAFWDFYIEGVRLFDIFSFILIFLFLFLSFIFDGHRISFLKPRNTLIFNIFLGICFLLSLVGVIQSDENLKPAFGFISGTIIFCIFYLSPLSIKNIKSIVLPFLIISVIFLYIQDIYYYISAGKILHPLYLIGAQPRALSSIFRPTGFYLEPANYCLALMMLLMVAEKYKFLTTKLYFISAVSILLSVSLWGYVVLFIFTLIRYTGKSKWAFFMASAFLCLVIGGFLVAKGDNTVIDFVVNRVNHISSDSSGAARYSGIKLISELGASDPSFWIGTGVSNNYIKYGSNGLAFILNAGGILGTGLIYLLLISLCNSGYRMKFGFYFLLLLTAAPLWSIFFWWVWLAFMLKDQDSLYSEIAAQANAVL